MRRTVFHLVLWTVALGLVTGAPAASRHHARSAATHAGHGATGHGATGRGERSRRAREAESADDCADLSRAKRRACEGRRRRADASADERSSRRAEAHRGDPCVRLSRRRRAACEREEAAADRAEARAARSAPRTPRGSASTAELRTSKLREVQPADLVGGVDIAAAPDPGAAGPSLRGPLGASPPERATRGGRRPARLHEVVLEDGQSLADLAARTGVSVADLARLNGIGSVDDVPTGMRLKVPAGAREASAPTRLASVPPPGATAPPAAEPAEPLPEPAPPVARPTRAERRLASVAPSTGPRPYASLGPVGAAVSSPAPAAPAAGRWGRTQADALAAYAVASARAPRLGDRADATHDRFIWPLRAEVVSGFGSRGLGQRNDGLDLAAHAGEAVRASAAGEVVYAGKEIAATGGNLVLLKHADGWVTAYSHLGRLTVGMRQTVSQGQEIAEAPDVAGGASVHFEVRQPGAGGAKPVDPATVLPARGGGETGRG